MEGTKVADDADADTRDNGTANRIARMSFILDDGVQRGEKGVKK